MRDDATARPRVPAFGVEPGVRVFLDASLRRFATVFPAAGSGNSAIELTLAELEDASGA